MRETRHIVRIIWDKSLMFPRGSFESFWHFIVIPTLSICRWIPLKKLKLECHSDLYRLYPKALCICIKGKLTYLGKSPQVGKLSPWRNPVPQRKLSKLQREKGLFRSIISYHYRPRVCKIIILYIDIAPVLCKIIVSVSVSLQGHAELSHYIAIAQGLARLSYHISISLQGCAKLSSRYHYHSKGVQDYHIVSLLNFHYRTPLIFVTNLFVKIQI